MGLAIDDESGHSRPPVPLPATGECGGKQRGVGLGNGSAR
jgi:hypothetical protein